MRNGTAGVRGLAQADLALGLRLEPRTLIPYAVRRACRMDFAPDTRDA